MDTFVGATAPWIIFKTLTGMGLGHNRHPKNLPKRFLEWLFLFHWIDNQGKQGFA